MNFRGEVNNLNMYGLVLFKLGWDWTQSVLDFITGEGDIATFNTVDRRNDTILILCEHL